MSWVMVLFKTRGAAKYWYDKASKSEGIFFPTEVIGASIGSLLYRNSPCYRTVDYRLDNFNRFKQLAEQGDAYAQVIFGVCYQDGKGVPKDKEQAVYWYTQAVEQRNSIAQFNLSALTKDAVEAEALLEEAASNGLVKAQIKLGQSYLYYQPQDYSKALYWFETAAEQESRDAFYYLGWMYKKGFGVFKNEHEAKYWYKKAAELKHFEAKYELARMENKKNK